MSRDGLEPSTLGLKVRPNKLQGVATSRNVVQIARIAAATNRTKTHRAETNLYADPYTQPPSTLTTPCGDGLLKALSAVPR
jgi:hypothetical protein